jgi:hypothetical protein
MYRVSLNHLDPKTIRPTLEIGIREHGKLSEGDLRALLTRFCQIDPTENAAMEPEVRVELKGDRYILKTGSGKIHFYDARDRQAPALVLTPGELLAELKRLAPPPRSVALVIEEPPEAAAIDYPLPVEPPVARSVDLPGNQDELAYVPPPPPPPSRRVPILAVTLVLLIGALVAVWFRSRETVSGSEPAVQLLSAADAAAAQRALVGVYMTGGEPGRHGIAIAEDGTAKFFRLNAQTAPSVVFDSVRLAQRGSSPVALVDRLGTVIEVTSRDTLVYCGETFRRIP